MSDLKWQPSFYGGPIPVKYLGNEKLRRWTEMTLLEATEHLEMADLAPNIMEGLRVEAQAEGIKGWIPNEFGVREPSSRIIGTYTQGTRTIKISMTSEPLGVTTFVHELGHHVWRYILSDAAKKHWSAYHAKLRHVTDEDEVRPASQGFWDIFFPRKFKDLTEEEAWVDKHVARALAHPGKTIWDDWDLGSMESYINRTPDPERLGKYLNAGLRRLGFLDDEGVTLKWSESPRWGTFWGQAEKAWQDMPRSELRKIVYSVSRGLKVAPPKSKDSRVTISDMPSNYAMSNAEENFCETFAAYVDFASAKSYGAASGEDSDLPERGEHMHLSDTAKHHMRRTLLKSQLLGGGRVFRRVNGE